MSKLRTFGPLPYVLAGALLSAPAAAQMSSGAESVGDGGPFRRIATFPVFLNTDVESETVAEIVVAANGGRNLVYTDGATENLGIVDITDPANPLPGGVVALGGEPTSVASFRRYALACVNTSADFVNPSGDLVVVDLVTKQIVRTIPLGGQPDAIAVSPSGNYAAICIENERDEDLGDGEPPQAPPGYVVIVDLIGTPATWSTRNVDLVGIPLLFPEDPEPEFVDINELDVAIVTLQENNHLVQIFLPTGQVIGSFPAGGVDLENVDVEENELIDQSASLRNVAREPDAVAWLSNLTFATADEGDLFGGSRGFTNWGIGGGTLFEAGNSLELLTARLGHYPEERSENKGCEPEGVEFGDYGDARYLFVGSERSSLVFVYELLAAPFFGAIFPTYRQALPTGVGPEGLVAIPRRDLFVVACEEDAREDKIRSTIVIYERTGEGNYPTIVSDDRAGASTPIPWAALSGLAAGDGDTAYTIYDSFYRESRIFTMDVGATPAVIESELALVDSGNVLRDALDALELQLPGTDDFDPANAINDNGTVNLDPEGIAAVGDGTFWLASEGAGNLVAGVSDPDDRPFESPNALVHVAADGTILEVVLLPLGLIQDQLRFGFEGVAVVGDELYVAFQRAWQDAGDPSDRARIGRYDTTTGTWTFAHYPLDTPTSPNGGWVGSSELVHVGGDTFAVLERDNQGGTDATIKRIYTFSTAGVTFRDFTEVASFDLLTKTLVLDLIDAGTIDATGGLMPEKLEGMAILADGTTLIVNDNDGVDDNSGETQLLRLDGLFD